MRFERVRQGAALVDLIACVGECGLQLRLVELLDQCAQGFDQRDTGTEQHGELSSGDGHVHRRDASKQPPKVDVACCFPRRLGLLEDFRRQDSVPFEHCAQRFCAVGVAGTLDRFAPCIDAFVRVDRHGLDLGGLGRGEHFFDAGYARHDLARAVFA